MVHCFLQLSLVLFLICFYRTDAINWSYTYDGDDQPVWSPVRRSPPARDIDMRTWSGLRNYWGKRSSAMAVVPVPVSRWRSLTDWWPFSSNEAMERSRKQTDNWNSLKGYWG
ncbi:uncharacterized protein LOC100901174 [Galendromus occidentalis]|uniref:Uncharacterized protein LOC100901174 n=1 Tax=Galendromus occidentalis TaxID=34638 RepID=A0AAJ6VZM3_9ACAR|nr:uncharacterized protein LOC100901174 [Galendromus occidentalis]